MFCTKHFLGFFFNGTYRLALDDVKFMRAKLLQLDVTLCHIIILSQVTLNYLNYIQSKIVMSRRSG